MNGRDKVKTNILINIHQVSKTIAIYRIIIKLLKEKYRFRSIVSRISADSNVNICQTACITNVSSDTQKQNTEQKEKNKFHCFA